MGAHDRAAAARARMEQVRREMAERRALRIRNARAVRERAQESLRKQGPVAAQVAKHMGELGRRAAKAGGWATEKTQRDTDYIMGFGADDEQPAGFTFRPPKAENPRPGGIGSLPEDEDAQQREPAPRPAATPVPKPAPPPPPTRQPVPKATPPPPARRPVREVLDDEDDFSNQSTWMRKK